MLITQPYSSVKEHASKLQEQQQILKKTKRKIHSRYFMLYL